MAVLAVGDKIGCSCAAAKGVPWTKSDFEGDVCVPVRSLCVAVGVRLSAILLGSKMYGWPMGDASVRRKGSRHPKRPLGTPVETL
jgi:hypothetical protein